MARTGSRRNGGVGRAARLALAVAVMSIAFTWLSQVELGFVHRALAATGLLAAPRPLDVPPDDPVSRGSCESTTPAAPPPSAASGAAGGNALAPPTAASAGLARDVRVDLRGGHLRIERRAVIDRCSPLLLAVRRALQFEPPGSELESAREAVFGAFSLSAAEVHWGYPRLELEGDQVVIADTASVSVYPGASSLILQQAAGTQTPDTTRVRMLADSGTAFWSGETLPREETPGEADWTLAGAEFLLVTARPTHAGEPVPESASPASAAKPGRPTDANVQTERASSKRPPPWLLAVVDGGVSVTTPAWLGITYGVPFLLLLVWGRRHLHGVDAAPRRTAPLVAGARAALMILLALVVVETLQRLGQAGLFAGSMSWLGGFWQFDPVYAVVLVACWPPSRRLAGRRVLWRWLWPSLAIILLATAAGFAILLALSMSRQRVAAGMAPLPAPMQVLFDVARLLAGTETPDLVEFGYQLIAAIVAGCLLLAQLCCAIAIVRETAGRGAGRTLLLFLAPFVFVLADLAPGARWLPLAVAAPLLGWGFARASRIWRPRRVGVVGTPSGRATTAVFALAATLVALPPDAGLHWSPSWLLSGADWALLRLWQIPAFALLLAYLADRGADGNPARLRGARDAGIVLMLALFFWRPEMRSAPLLVSMWVAGEMLTRWTFAPRPLRDPGARLRLLSRAIADIRRYNRLVQFRGLLAKGLGDKTAKGEIEAVDALAKMDALDQLAAAGEGAVVRRRGLATLALNAGPRGTPWQRGSRGALVAAMLGLPWIASFLATGLGGETSADIVSRLNLMALDIARWPVLGFFFLYFYPHLRGHNGIRKGLVMATTLLLPAFLATTATAHGDDQTWAAFKFWAVQTFVACMVLGVLVGDLGALRKTGRGLGGLVEIYNLGTLAAWSSSLVLAVGVAITTAVAGQAAPFLGAQLQYVVPSAFIARPAPPASAAQPGNP